MSFSQCLIVLDHYDHFARYLRPHWILFDLNCLKSMSKVVDMYFVHLKTVKTVRPLAPCANYMSKDPGGFWDYWCQWISSIGGAIIINPCLLAFFIFSDFPFRFAFFLYILTSYFHKRRWSKHFYYFYYFYYW